MSSTYDADNEWQRIWFSIRHQRWSSLALVPSHPAIDVYHVAEMLAATARRQGERPVSIISGIGVQLENVEKVIESVVGATSRGDWVIVPVDAIADNPSAIALVQSATAALMVLNLGESLLSSAQAALDAVGRDRFLGSIVLDASKPAFS
jgi:hypothetical protein